MLYMKSFLFIRNKLKISSSIKGSKVIKVF